MVKLYRGLCGLYASFWLVLGVLVTLGVADLGISQGAPAVGVLLLLNGVALVLAATLTARGSKLFDLCGLALFAANAILSLTDQVGWIDAAAFVVSLGFFFFLLAALRWRPGGKPESTPADLSR